MARRFRFSPKNALNNLLGFATLGAAAYYLWREFRIARMAASYNQVGGAAMRDLRRAGRKAGRSVRDAAEHAGREVGRRAVAVGDAFRPTDPAAPTY